MLELTYGQVPVGAGGSLRIGIGAVLAARAAMCKFLRHLDLGATSHRTRQVVTGL